MKKEELMNPQHLTNKISEADLIKELAKVKKKNEALRKSFKYDAISMSQKVTI